MKLLLKALQGDPFTADGFLPQDLTYPISLLPDQLLKKNCVASNPMVVDSVIDYPEAGQGLRAGPVNLVSLDHCFFSKPLKK